MIRHIVLLCLFSILATVHAVHAKSYKSSSNTITVALESYPISIIPMLYTGSLSGQIAAQVFSSVCRLDGQGNLVPYLAKSFEYSDDYKKVTIQLRENATFHDQTLVTAKDVAFSLDVARQIHAYRTVFEQLRNISIHSEYSLSLTFAVPQPHFMKILIPALLPVLPQHVYKTVEGVQNSRLDTTFVGSGPFQPVLYTKDSIVLKKYSGFFIEGKPYLEGIIYRIYTDVGENYYGIVEGETDISAFRWRYSEENFEIENPEIGTLNAGYNAVGPYVLLQLNLGRPPLNHPLVRKALSLAIDRGFLASKGFHRKACPMYGPIPQKDRFYSVPQFEHKYSIQKANDLLDEAGFPRNVAGVRMQIETEVAPYTGQMSIILEYLQYEFARTIGVELVIHTPKDFENWGETITSGKYSSTIDELFSWHDPFIGMHRLYASTNRKRQRVWSNTADYSNADVDKLLFLASAESDPVLRGEIYKKVQQIIGGDYAALWLTSAPYTTVYNKRVSGLEQLPLGTMSPMDEIRTIKTTTDETKDGSQ